MMVSATPTPQEIAQDMQRRLRPTATAHGHAMALLAAEPRAEVAFIPMVLPGRTRGEWVYGQEVYTVPGVVLLASRDPEGNEVVPDYGLARITACELARGELDIRGGVAAYAVIARDGSLRVFQD